jgi:hypothetical protein
MRCVSKYCAIKGRSCEKEAPEVHDRCCFIAYPFQQPFLDITDKVERNLALQGYRMEVPRPSRMSTGLLFCDNVCPMITKSNLVLGEITSLNHNVFFELGYASGLRKPVMLLRNAGLKHETNSILDSGLYINHYQTSEQIVSAVVSRGAAAKAWFDGGPQPSQPDSVAVLTPNHEYHKTEIGRAIRQRIAEHRLTVIQEAGTEIDLLRKIRMILSAEWVVGDLVSDQAVNSHALNSETAFLLGMAVSLEKKVIVLQEEPVGKPMIDLAGLLARYTGIDSLMRILAERLNVIVTRTIERFDHALQTTDAETRALEKILEGEGDGEFFAEWTGETAETTDDDLDVMGGVDDGLVTSFPYQDDSTHSDSVLHDDDDALQLTAGDGVALGDSDILLSPADDGTSLGDSDLSLASASDEGISLEAADDEAFDLTSDDDAIALDLDSDDDGSQVIALDADDEQSDSGSQVIAFDDEEGLDLEAEA